MWNYAQHYAMSDNAYTDDLRSIDPWCARVFAGRPMARKTRRGPYGAHDQRRRRRVHADRDTDPAYDTCSSTTSQVQMTGKNIGDLLNAAHLTWGSFMGGFNLQTMNPTAPPAASAAARPARRATTDYTPHHAWFQYYASTANPTHARPSRPRRSATARYGRRNG